MTDEKQTPGWPANLKRAEAARYLAEVHGIPVATNTLANWFSEGSEGPPAFKVGRTPLYPRTLLDEWARQRLGAVARRFRDLPASDEEDAA